LNDQSEKENNEILTSGVPEGRETPGWQPIETLMEWDRPVLLFSPRDNLYEKATMQEHPDLTPDEWRVGTRRSYTWATHWMPLPPSPAEAQTGGARAMTEENSNVSPGTTGQGNAGSLTPVAATGQRRLLHAIQLWAAAKADYERLFDHDGELLSDLRKRENELLALADEIALV
jgi:hypothetical protein